MAKRNNTSNSDKDKAKVTKAKSAKPTKSTKAKSAKKSAEDNSQTAENDENVLDNKMSDQQKSIIWIILGLFILFVIIVFYLNHRASKRLKAANKLTNANAKAFYEEVSKFYNDTPAAGSAKLLLVQDHLSQGKTDEAEKTLDDFLKEEKNHPLYANGLILKGSLFLTNNESPSAEKAIEYFKQAEKFYKKNGVAPAMMLGYLRWGEALESLEKFEEAKELYIKVTKENLGSPYLEMFDERLLSLESRQENLEKLPVPKEPKEPKRNSSEDEFQTLPTLPATTPQEQSPSQSKTNIE